MEVQVDHSPSFAVATVKLSSGEAVRADGGAMVSMSTGLEIKTAAHGGVLKALKRQALGGESFFLTTYTAGSGDGWARFGSFLPGDVVVEELTSGTLMVQSGSFLASSTDVEIDTKWGGAKTFFGGEGLFLLRCTGLGKLILNSYGAIDRYTLADGEKMTVDTGHIVSFDESVKFNVRKFGGLKSTLLSGEGLVVEMTGPGDVMTQTRSSNALERWIKSFVPKGN